MNMRASALCLLLLLELAAPAAGALEPVERWQFSFDAREWKPVRQSIDAPPGENTYVLPGENAYFWTEQITSGYKGVATAPDEYIAEFIQNLLERCRPLKVSPVEQTPTSVIFQWEGDCRIVGPQFEYRRVVAGRNGVHYLAYSAKPARLTPEKKAAWLAVLRNAMLK